MKLVLLSLLSIVFLSAKAQSPIFFVTPGITVGYTFGAKINYGITFDFGLVTKTKDANYKVGFSAGYYFVKTKNSTHRLRSFSLMAQNNFMSIKLGVGRARNRWGYGNRNRCIVRGFNYDASFSVPTNNYNPWIGIKQFIYKPSQWAWFNKPYTSLYLQEKNSFILQDNTVKNMTIFK